MGQDRLASGKKNSARLGSSLVFIDESGFLMMPLVQRTWAPRGQTPLFQHRTNSYRKVSAIAALVVSPGRDRVRLFFRLHPNSNINAGKVLSFLQDLSRHYQCPITLVWDRFTAHRARRVKAYIDQKKGWRSEHLPPYAPELNPVEYAWCYLKTHAMANEAVFEHDRLTRSVRRHGKALQRRQPLLRSFLKHSPLFLRLR